MKSWDDLSPYLSDVPGLQDFVILDLVGTGALALISIAFGALLWSAPPNGRTLASIYLAVRFFGFLALIALEAASAQRLPSQFANEIWSSLFGAFLREALFLLVWGLYFSRSRRVRATFSDEDPTGSPR